MDFSDFTVVWKIDINTPEGKQLLHDIYIDAVINEDSGEELVKFTTNEVALKQYLQALCIIKSLAEQGKCTYECDNVYKHYISHSIYVTWTEQDGFIEPPLEELGKLCDLSDGLLISAMEEPFWQFSKRIYTDLSTT